MAAWLTSFFLSRLSQEIYSRVSQVCKNDGVDLYYAAWTTFVKSRLRCQVTTGRDAMSESTFQYNILTSVSDVTQVVLAPGGPPVDVVFATFTTPR